jgi:hypothetical protein
VRGPARHGLSSGVDNRTRRKEDDILVCASGVALEMIPRGTVELVVTTYCPYNCEKCYGRDVFGTSGRHVDFDVLIERLKRLTRVHPLKENRLGLIGGEPLTHPRIIDLVGQALDMWPVKEQRSLTIITSGCSDKMVESLRPLLAREECGWALSYYGRMNDRRYMNLLAEWIGLSAPGSRIDTNLVFSDVEGGLKTLGLLRQTLERFTGKKGLGIRESAFRKKLEAVQAQRSRASFSLEISLPERRMMVLRLAQASGIHIDSGKAPVCTLLAEGAELHATIDEGGLLRPCITPNQRLAAPLYPAPIENLDPLPEDVTPAIDGRRAALAERMLDRMFKSGKPSAVANEEGICRICASL